MAVTLADVFTDASAGITKSDGSLTTTLKGLGDGSKMSMTDMIGLQYNMTVFTVTTQACSAVVKEMGDCFKSVIQKV